MNPNAHDHCCCSWKMHEGRHDSMVRVGNEIVVIKDVSALICDTCGEVEYTLEISREIDVIMKEFFAGRLLAKPLAGERSHSSPSGQTRRGELTLAVEPVPKGNLQKRSQRVLTCDLRTFTTKGTKRTKNTQRRRFKKSL